jgi:MAD, mothers against decapentaplegic interacting protein
MIWRHFMNVLQVKYSVASTEMFLKCSCIEPVVVTGASFIVFNGALKQSSGLRAKSSIIEDGLMVQITAESMTSLKHALRDMKDYVIACGNASSEQPDEFVAIEWVADEHNANTG